MEGRGFSGLHSHALTVAHAPISSSLFPYEERLTKRWEHEDSTASSDNTFRALCALLGYLLSIALGAPRIACARSVRRNAPASWMRVFRRDVLNKWNARIELEKSIVYICVIQGFF